jgi:DNA-binding MarR family transcriptional regulator
MQDAGMRVTQFTLLQVLEKASPIAQGRLGEVLALDSTTLTRSLKLVEKEGWVTSAPGYDRRERHFSITAKGKKQLQIAKERWRQAQSKLRKHLNAGDWEQFMALADRITEAAIAAREST